MKLKTIMREDWSRIQERRSAYTAINLPEFTGAASLLCLDRVTAPVAKPLLGAEITIVDTGYRWLQIAPAGAHWWLTAMYDENGSIVQYYFDVAKETVVQGTQSYFLDLYLDVVALPGGEIILLDRDELDEALQTGDITAADHQLAIDTADMLLRELPGNLPRLAQFCSNLLEFLAAKCRRSAV